MSDLPLRPHRWGPLDALYSAVRRSLPQVLVSHVRAAPQPYIRVTYKNNGPADVAYIADAAQYQWIDGGSAGTPIGGRDDLDGVLQVLAAFLDAKLSPPPADPPPCEGDA